ncbi:MAG TPA: ABC transporter substrate-binding protein [Candidatus Binatia bacterium]|nr:ABC transporter substrate-binding protein [Candidatus Binatia bacterium]
MSNRKNHGWTRREFLGGAALAGTGALLLRSEAAAAEPPPETTKLKLDQRPSICVAAQYVAEEFLRAEGFTDVQYIKKSSPKDIEPALASGEVDMGLHFAAPNIVRIEARDATVILSGAHVGCFELFGTNRVRAIRDLKGKSVAVSSLGDPAHIFLSSMVAFVGLDPRKDINWVTHPVAESMRLLAEGRVDGFLGFPPQPQELRAKRIGHVVVNSMMDRPWSQYFCCMVTANKEFARKHPIATKRALRGILKGADVCAREPERVARFLVDKGYTQNYDYALQTMKEMQMAYGVWREYDPEDTLRFYALRLHEAGMIKSSPQKIIAQGTDWRFLREIKKEMKG